MNAPADGLLAGSCEVDTTPALGTDLAGYFESRHADRIERRLYAKALALRSDDTTVLLISADIIMMRAEDVVDAAKRMITERTGVPASHILISATHTHNAPATVHRPTGPVVDPRYLVRLTDSLVEAAVGAVTTLRPARLGYGQAPVAGVCFNRRYRRADGQVQTNPGYDRDDLVGPAAPIDPTVTGLVVEERDGTPLAFWSNLSLHYVNAATPTSISSDYYGAFGERMRQLVGAPMHVQLTNGCSGDINNVDLDRAVSEQGLQRAELVATAVAGAAAAGAMMAARSATVPLSSTLVEVELDRAPVTDDDVRTAEDILAGTHEDATFSYVQGLPIPAKLAKHYAARLLPLAEAPERRTVPVMIMTIGDLCVVGLPGEIFVEHGLAIREGSRYGMTAVVGLANDHIGYVPTLLATTEGGYETWRDTISWTAPGSGERMVEAVLEVIRADQ